MHSSMSHQRVNILCKQHPDGEKWNMTGPLKPPLLPVFPSSHYYLPIGNQLPDSESHPQVSHLGASPRPEAAQGAGSGDVTRSGMTGKCLDRYDNGPAPGVCVAPLKTALTFSKGRKAFLAAFHQSRIRQNRAAFLCVRASPHPGMHSVKGQDFSPLASLAPGTP